MIILSNVMVAFIIFLALWRRDIFFYFMACPVSITAGLMWRSRFDTPDGIVMSLALVGIGIYCLIMGIYNMVRYD